MFAVFKTVSQICCFQQERKREAAEAESARRRYILEIVGHELRTPLSPIFTWTDTLNQHLHATPLANDPIVTQACAGLHRASRTLKRLVDDLNDYAALSHGKLSLKLSKVDLTCLLNDCIVSFGSRADAAKIRLHNQLACAPIHITGDETRLQQCVLNLLNNTLKFTPPGGVVTLSLAADEKNAFIEVRDTGDGIAMDKLSMLFEPFRQGENSNRSGNGGLGLGLAIVKSLVELHGGSIDAHSDGPGTGSSFRITLPLFAPR